MKKCLKSIMVCNRNRFTSISALRTEVLLVFLILFLSCFSTFLQAQEVSILYDQTGNLTLMDAPLETFTSIESGYTNGLNQGVYWLQIDSSSEASNFQLENNHINKVEAYQDFLSLDVDHSNGFMNFSFVPNAPVFIRLEVDKEAYFPFTIRSQVNLERIKLRETAGLGIFYGFAAVILLLNLALFLVSKEVTLLYYAIFLFFVLAVFAHRDGFVEILGLTHAIMQITEPISLAIGGIACSLFSMNALNLKKHFPFIAFSYWGVALMSLFLLVLLILYGDYMYVIGIYFICLYIFVSSWIASFLLWNTHKYAPVFCLAYFFMMCMAILFYLGPIFKIHLFEVRHIYLKITALLEMLVITSAIIYRMRVVRRQQKAMRSEMKKYLSEIAFLSEELEKNKKGQVNVFTKFDLTDRENQILELIAQGKTNKEIADEIFISVNTVKFHVKKIYEKLDVSNRKDASKIIKKQKLV